MAPHDVTADSETRWPAWLAKGRARELRTRHSIKVFVLVVACGAAAVTAFVLGFWVGGRCHVRYLNRWFVSCAWVAAMIATRFGLAPSALSGSSWIFATLGGLVALVGTAMFWEARCPTPSFRQAQVAAEAATAGAGRRP